MSVEREVGLFEAKTHLSELVSEVEGGSSITLTRRGKPVARLVPVHEDKLERRAQALRRMREMGARRLAEHGPTSIEEILSARDEGRR